MKWVRTGPAQARTEPWRLRAELATLKFLSDDLGLALAPRVIAADVSAGFLILEDLAPRVALDLLIRRDGAAAHPLRLHRFAVLDTRAPGDHSRLQLVETLESAARTAEAHRAVPHLAGWARRTADVLRRRWPDADLDLTDWARFPPYSPRRASWSSVKAQLPGRSASTAAGAG